MPRWANLWKHTEHLLDCKSFAFGRMQKVLNIFALANADILTDPLKLNCGVGTGLRERSRFCIVFSMAYIEIGVRYLSVITLLFNRYCDTLTLRLGRSQTWQY
jgi:hypothetical protein